MAVEEFTEAGVLVPSDRMSWTGSEDSGGRSAGGRVNARLVDGGKKPAAGKAGELLEERTVVGT